MAEEIDKFKEKVDIALNSAEIDECCIRWLRSTSSDYGKEGVIAKKLLDIICELLEIYL